MGNNSINQTFNTRKLISGCLLRGTTYWSRMGQISDREKCHRSQRRSKASRARSFKSNICQNSAHHSARPEEDFLFFLQLNSPTLMSASFPPTYTNTHSHTNAKLFHKYHINIYTVLTTVTMIQAITNDKKKQQNSEYHWKAKPSVTIRLLGGGGVGGVLFIA